MGARRGRLSTTRRQKFEQYARNFPPFSYERLRLIFLQHSLIIAAPARAFLFLLPSLPPVPPSPVPPPPSSCLLPFHSATSSLSAGPRLLIQRLERHWRFRSVKCTSCNPPPPTTPPPSWSPPNFSLNDRELLWEGVGGGGDGGTVPETFRGNTARDKRNSAFFFFPSCLPPLLIPSIHPR